MNDAAELWDILRVKYAGRMQTMRWRPHCVSWKRCRRPEMCRRSLALRSDDVASRRRNWCVRTPRQLWLAFARRVTWPATTPTDTWPPDLASRLTGGEMWRYDRGVGRVPPVRWAIAGVPYCTRWVKKLSCCTVIWYIFQRLDNSPNVKYSITVLWTVQGLKVGNTYFISVVKYSMLHTYDVMFTKLVRVWLAVISLIAFSHRKFKHKTIAT